MGRKELSQGKPNLSGRISRRQFLQGLTGATVGAIAAACAPQPPEVSTPPQEPTKKPKKDSPTPTPTVEVRQPVEKTATPTPEKVDQPTPIPTPTQKPEKDDKEGLWRTRLMVAPEISLANPKEDAELLEKNQLAKDQFGVLRILADDWVARDILSARDRKLDGVGAVAFKDSKGNFVCWAMKVEDVARDKEGNPLPDQFPIGSLIVPVDRESSVEQNQIVPIGKEQILKLGLDGEMPELTVITSNVDDLLEGQVDQISWDDSLNSFVGVKDNEILALVNPRHMAGETVYDPNRQLDPAKKTYPGWELIKQPEPTSTPKLSPTPEPTATPKPEINPEIAPEVIGLKRIVEQDRIVYRAEAGNSYGLKEGAFAGYYHPEVYLRRDQDKDSKFDPEIQTGGISLRPEVIKPLLYQAGYPDKTVFPIPFELKEGKVEIMEAVDEEVPHFKLPENGVLLLSLPRDSRLVNCFFNQGGENGIGKFRFIPQNSKLDYLSVRCSPEGLFEGGYVLSFLIPNGGNNVTEREDVVIKYGGVVL